MGPRSATSRPRWVGSQPTSGRWIPAYERRLAEGRALDAFVDFARGVGPRRARQAPPWLMKLLLLLLLSPGERRRRLGLLRENLREHREVARLDSCYEHYREISADVLLMRGGKSDLPWVAVAMERLAAVLPRSETKVFPSLDHFGIDKQGPGDVARAVSAFFLTATEPG